MRSISIVFAALCILASNALAMQKYSDIVSDKYGNVQPGVSLTIKNSNGSTATIYSDNGVTLAANPLTSDANGGYSFYAADGVYTIWVNGNQVGQATLFDPASLTSYAPKASPTFSGTATFNSAAQGVTASSTGLTIQRAGTGVDWNGATSNTSATIPFWVSANHTGSASIVGGAYLNAITINSDTVNLTSSQAVNGLSLYHNFGGGSSSGSRQALQAYLVQVGATTSAANGVDPFFVGGAFYSIGQYSEGGAAASYLTGKGHVFGLNPVARLRNTATNYYEVTGMEVNVSAASGTSVGGKKGIQIVKESADAVQGAHGIDTALMIGDQSGASVGWNYGMTFGAAASQWPIDSAGTLIGSSQGNVKTVAANAAYGVDFSPVLFSTSAFKSMGWAVSGGGAVTASSITVGGASIASTSGGAKISVPNKVANAVAVSAGGSGYIVGERITTSSGGVYQVSSVSGTAITGVTALVWDSSSSPPSNPVATTSTLTNGFVTGGSGATLNLTWASGKALTLSGDSITSIDGALGYSTGAGGAVTQATDKTTGVTVNKPSMQITTAASALAAGAKTTFTVTDSAVAATDVPVCAVASGGTANAYRASVTAVGSGTFNVTVENITGGSLSESPVINCNVIKGASS